MDAKPAYRRRTERAAELRAAHAELMVGAGLSAPRYADALEQLFEVHAYTRDAPSQSVEALQGVIAAAENADKTKRWSEKLHERVRALPVGLRFSIVEYQGYRDGEYIAAETPTAVVLERSRELLKRVRRGRGRPRAELATLLFGIVLLLEHEFPNGGVTKNGSKANEMRADGGDGQDYLYSGPLLDLVQRLLDVEGIEYESRGALGRELWQLTRQGQSAEERHATGKCVSCENAVTDAARWLCDECSANLSAKLS